MVQFSVRIKFYFGLNLSSEISVVREITRLIFPMKNNSLLHIDFSKKWHYTINTPPEIVSPTRHPQQCGMALLKR